MPVTISNQRLGPVGQYSSKHPRPRDVFHPGGKMDMWRWEPVPSDLPIFAGSSTSVNVLSDRQQLAVTLQQIVKILCLQIN